MKKRPWKQGLAVMLGLMLGLSGPAGSLALPQVAYGYTARSATVNASTLNVRSGAGTSYSSVAKLAQGTAVTVIGETTASDGKLWYQIRFTGSGGASATGYVLSTYVRFPVAYTHDGDFEAQLSAQGFPESYKDSLRQLHAQYPNWTFTAQQTGLDWNTVIQNESVLGRNMVHTGSISSFKSTADGAYNWDTGVWTGLDGSTWVAASEDVIRYYMDPRNFLDPVYIFQFMSQKYDASIHTREGLEAMLKGTFMDGSTISGTTGGDGTGSGSSPVVGPGASSGQGTGSGSVTLTAPGGQGATISGGQNGESQTSQTPGGQDAVLSGPGVSDGAAGSGQSQTGTDQAPGGSTDGVRLEGPMASISSHNAPLVAANVIVAGPGGSSSNSSASPSPGESGTQPSGQTTTVQVSYVDAIMKAAQESGVSPYVIAAMIIQEQGRDGRGNSIKGNYAGYVGYYNYFNVGAYASDGMEAVERGLWYASQSGSYGRPWNTPESSIIGGAQFYGTNYVNAGQDTLYLKKYNVQGSNMYKHQYMTNVDGAASEGSIFAEGFSDALKQTALNFKIPVYTNMPESPCAKPTIDGSPNNKLAGLTADGFVLTPTFNKDTVSYDLIVDHSVSNVTIQAVTIDSKAQVSGTGNIQLQSGNNEITVNVTAENGDVRTYMIHVVRQTGGPTYNSSLGGGAGTDAGSAQGPGVVVVGPGVSTGGQDTGSSGPGISAGSAGFSAPGGAEAVLVGPGN